MGLPAILDKIRALGNAQLQEIEKSTLSQEGEILAHACTEAEQIEKEACLKASATAIAERARILHRARLDGLRIVGNTREGMVDTAIRRTCEQLTSFRCDPAYPLVLRALIEEALAQLASPEGDEKPRILADPCDQALIQKILSDLQLSNPVGYELNCQGGLIAQSEDGCIVVINTLEARLKQAAPFLRSCLAAFFAEENFKAEQMEPA